MRLVTWNLSHRPNGALRTDRLVTALASLAPDIAILEDPTPDADRTPLLAALAGIGLDQQLTTRAGPHDGRILLASRLAMVLGTLDADVDGCAVPSSVLHAYTPNGALDVLGLRIRGCGRRHASRSACWNWLQQAAASLKHRRAVMVGDFEHDAADDASAMKHHLRHFLDEGWQHAVSAERGAYASAVGNGLHLDHAFLSPSVQRIDARYALEAAGLRLAGSKESLAERPALVVDLQ